MSRGWWSLTGAAEIRVKYLVFTGSPSLESCRCLAGSGLSRGLHRLGLII